MSAKQTISFSSLLSKIRETTPVIFTDRKDGDNRDYRHNRDTRDQVYRRNYDDSSFSDQTNKQNSNNSDKQYRRNYDDSSISKTSQNRTGAEIRRNYDESSSISKTSQNRTNTEIKIINPEIDQVIEIDDQDMLLNAFNTETNKRENVAPINERERSVFIPKKQHDFDKKSLAHFVNELRKGIVSIANEKNHKNINAYDIPILENFSQLYLDPETKSDWHKMMDCIMEKIIELDKQYLSLNYFGLKEKITLNLINICFSHIIIGRNTKYGEGIDNLYEPIYDFNRKPINRNSDPLYKRIKTYVKYLPIILKIIGQNNQNIFISTRLNKELDYKNTSINSNILILNTMIKKQKKNGIVNSVNVNNDNNETKLEKLFIEQADLEKQINQNNIQINDWKKDTQSKISELEKCIDFDYFMHSSWCSALDNAIPYRF